MLVLILMLSLSLSCTQGTCTSLCESSQVVAYQEQLSSLYEGSVCSNPGSQSTCGQGALVNCSCMLETAHKQTDALTCTETLHTNKCLHRCTYAGFVCGAALPSCQTNFQCSVITPAGEPAYASVTGDACPGMCFRTAKEMVSAKLSAGGDAIEVSATCLALVPQNTAERQACLCRWRCIDARICIDDLSFV